MTAHMVKRSDEDEAALMMRRGRVLYSRDGESHDIDVRLLVDGAPVEVDGREIVGHMRARRAARALTRIGVTWRIVRVSDKAVLSHTDKHGSEKLPTIVLPVAYSAAEDAAELEGL